MLDGIKRLKAWELGHKLVLEVYRVTKQLPREELWGLTYKTGIPDLRLATCYFLSARRHWVLAGWHPPQE